VATNANARPIQKEDQEKLVRVFDTNDGTEALVVQGLLDSSGIESLLTNLDAPQDVLPGVGGVVLRVRASQADEARALIEEQRNAEPPNGEPTDEEVA
jgi:hypothetical protein